MIRLIVALVLLLTGTSGVAVAEVLIVADEFPAMELLAAKLKSAEHIDSRVIAQKDLPANLAPFEAVIVYIHKELLENVEDAFIDYTKSGGKLVVLHHSISSGKRKNRHWFPFLGVALPEGDVTTGGYKWIHPVTVDLVNLNPNHFIMTNGVSYPARIAYATTKATVRDGSLPGFTLKDSEVYLNHSLIGPRMLLMGFKYVDAASKTTYQQDTAGWIKPAGKGWIIYFNPGHSVSDFENPTYAQIVLNAVIFKP